MPTAIDLVALEDAWVAEGIREQPSGSNHTSLGAAFGWNGVAWCAITQTLALGAVFGRELFRSAAVVEWINAAGRGAGGMELLPADAPIEAGMLVTYDFGPANGKARGNPANFHIAMVRDPGTQAKFQTDAGNEGDAMRQQWRDRRYVTHFIRLPFDQPAAPAMQQGAFDMTPGQCRDLTGRKWFFMVGDDQALFASIDAAKPFRIGGIWTSGVDALCEEDGRLVITGRAADGQLQQCIVYTDGNTVKAAGSAPEFELLGGHIFPPA